MTGMTTRRAYLVRLGLAIITVPTLGEAIKGHASAKPTAEGSFGRRLENAQDLCVLIGAFWRPHNILQGRHARRHILLAHRERDHLPL